MPPSEVICSESRGHLLAGAWTVGDGPSFSSHDPSTGDVVWTGPAATERDVSDAVSAAREAFDQWAWFPVERRIEHLERFAALLKSNQVDLAEIISRETGKPRWEAMEEVATMAAKVPTAIQAFRERRGPVVGELGGATAATRYRPHGVVAVFGPFNFPGHLPNGHIVPALLAGNTVVFKPSEYTPLTGERTAELWLEAGLPRGVFNLVQGSRPTGEALAKHPDVDGLFFTGSVPAGLSLHRAWAGDLHKILALELGGNNPLVVWDAADPEAAAVATIQSAYITAGQRCSCARRLIVPADREGHAFVEHLAQMLPKVRVGRWTNEPEPFLGPVISPAAADRLLEAQEDLRERGGRVVVPMARISDCPAMLSPGLMDVSAVGEPEDVEHFGPFLQVIFVADFDAAVREANRTQFGLSAALLSDRRELWETFYRRIRTGVVNWNRPTTGASGKLPFGGIGLSGNHRPSGYFAADYCSYPVASLESEKLTVPEKLPPGLEG